MSSFVIIQSESMGTKNIYLLDTGATISILKINKLMPNSFINKNFKCKISGISDSHVTSYGISKKNLYIDNIVLEHQFHIVDTHFPVPACGILGLDFITKYNCILDYGDQWKLIIKPTNISKNLILPIHNAPSEDCLTLPARCEVIRHINLNINQKEVLIPNQQIGEGIYIGRTIVSKDNAYVRIINTTNENKILYNVKINTENLEDYIIYNLNEYENTHRDKIIEKIKNNCPPFANTNLTKLCTDFSDVFALDSDKVTVNNFYRQKLRLKDDTPVYIKNYRTAATQKTEINEQVKKMLKNKVIEPSISEYNSPILLVPKKSLPGNPDKRWRLVIDYRQLNKKLLADKFPLPRIDEILDQLGRARFFSCLDLLSGFHQIELDEESRDVTSFSTDQGSFRFRSLPFGLKVAPNSFQRMMSLAFAGLSPEKCFIYMDDLVVIASSERQMINNLKDVLLTCRKFNLKLNPDKCTFFRHEVTYLGHKCTDKGILPDDTKYAVIKNYPRPTDADSARRFVAFCNYYRRFIQNFAYYSYHLTRLTRKNVEFNWTKECEDAFTYLKDSLICPPILQYPNFKETFCITTDASKIACGAILSQEYDGKQLPVAYASRGFTKGEQNKSVIERELAAIHWALNYFRPYIFGTKFLVKSDHRPLSYLFSMKNPSSKLTRMRLDLEEYDFEIQYIKGTDNVCADALSRIDFNDIKELTNTVATINKMTTRSETRKTSQPTIIASDKNNKESKPIKIYEVMNAFEVRKFPHLKFKLNTSAPQCIVKKGKRAIIKFELLNYFVNENLDLTQVFSRLEKEANEYSIVQIQLSLNDSIFNTISIQGFKEITEKSIKNIEIALTPIIKIIYNNEEKTELIDKYHNDPMFGGHCGTKRLYYKMRSKYHWKYMTKDIAKFVKSCIKCQENKSLEKSKEKLSITPTPQKAFDIVQIDTIGPLPKSDQGNEYVVTIICELTKYLVTVPIPNKRATTIAKAIFENFILIYGPMKQITTDRGTEYLNSTITELCKLLGIGHNTSTAYHHRSLGTIERSHRTFNEYIRSYINEKRNDWDDYLNFFTYFFNTTPSTAIGGYCPFQLIFAKLPENFDFLCSDIIDPIYNIDAYEKEIKYRLQFANQRAQQIVKHNKLMRKINYDTKAKPQIVKPADLVLVERNPRHKLEPLYKGPYKVKNLENPNVRLTDEEGNEVLVHKDKIKKFQKLFYFRFYN